MRNLFYFISGFLFISSIHYAQLTVKDQESSPNTLFQVIDEGSSGSIFLPPLGSSLTGTKLYNYGGNLFWGSNQLGLAGSAGGWTDGGSSIYNTTLTDKVGIGTASPSANLHVSGDDGVLFTGTYGSGTIPAESYGTRMMWYPKKAAFRAGYVNSTQWDSDSIGNYSIAMGVSTKASGISSTAMGASTKASGISSTAMGTHTKATGSSSTAMGAFTMASGRTSYAMGDGTKAEAYISTAIGRSNVGGGSATEWIATDPLFEIGIGTYTTPTNALTVLKNGKVGIGIATPGHELHVHETSSNFSYANFTNETTGSGGGNSGVLIGLDANEDFRIHSFEDNNIKFFINNGEKVRINNSGNVGIGTTSPDYKLEVNGDAAKSSGGTSWSVSSDRRLKDINGNYGKGLDEIISLEPKQFNYKKSNARDLPSDTEEIGFIAQEVQEVFPEAVNKGKDGYLDFNMHPINVAMVNAIKEQQKIIEELKDEILELKKVINPKSISRK